ncbi:MAG: hypothetical protein IPL79_01210 [Myxococcales bacterium]|nr:hypothetical protein [Myxococcales bacterium]
MNKLTAIIMCCLCLATTAPSAAVAARMLPGKSSRLTVKQVHSTARVPARGRGATLQLTSKRSTPPAIEATKRVGVEPSARPRKAGVRAAMALIVKRTLVGKGLKAIASVATFAAYWGVGTLAGIVALLPAFEMLLVKPPLAIGLSLATQMGQEQIDSTSSMIAHTAAIGIAAVGSLVANSYIAYKHLTRTSSTPATLP